MSRYLEYKNGLPIEVIEDMNICKHCINDMCCNDSSEYLGLYYTEKICNENCENYVEEDDKNDEEI